VGRACDTHRGNVKSMDTISRKSKGNRTFGRPTRRWENIRIGHKEIRRGVVNWIYLTKNRCEPVL
jgi:hypothetical protein